MCPEQWEVGERWVGGDRPVVRPRGLISGGEGPRIAGMSISRRAASVGGMGVVFSVLCVAMNVRAEDGKVFFQDSFKGKLGEGWRWVREDPKHWRVGEAGLEVHVQPGNMWGGANNAKNVLVRRVGDPKEEPMEITVVVANRPTAQYEQVDLVWYYDDSNMVKIGQELVDGKLSIVMGREQNDRTRTIAILPLDGEEVELRFEVRGDKIRGLFKMAKADWRVAGECDLPVKGVPNVSLQFYQGPDKEEHWARVSSFAIRRLSVLQ